MNAVSDVDGTRLSITLDGMPGETQELRFRNAYIHGVRGTRNFGQPGVGAMGGYGTAWEMTIVGRHAHLARAGEDGYRPWNAIAWYVDGVNTPMAEPDWLELRKAAGQ